MSDFFQSNQQGGVSLRGTPFLIDEAGLFDDQNGPLELRCNAGDDRLEISLGLPLEMRLGSTAMLVEAGQSDRIPPLVGKYIVALSAAANGIIEVELSDDLVFRCVPKWSVETWEVRVDDELLVALPGLDGYAHF